MWEKRWGFYTSVFFFADRIQNINRNVITSYTMGTFVASFPSFFVIPVPFNKGIKKSLNEEEVHIISSKQRFIYLGGVYHC